MTLGTMVACGMSRQTWECAVIGVWRHGLKVRQGVESLLRKVAIQLAITLMNTKDIGSPAEEFAHAESHT